MAGSGASHTAALAFGGEVGPPTGKTESWNGTAWTEITDLSSARQYLSGTGTQTTSLAYGGNNGSTYAVGFVEEFNGAGVNTSDFDLS